MVLFYTRKNVALLLMRDNWVVKIVPFAILILTASGNNNLIYPFLLIYLHMFTDN